MVQDSTWQSKTCTYGREYLTHKSNREDTRRTTISLRDIHCIHWHNNDEGEFAEIIYESGRIWNVFDIEGIKELKLLFDVSE